MTKPDIEAIRQSPRQYADLETVEALSDYAMILEQQIAELTMERDEAVSAVQRLTEGIPFDAVVIADGIRRGIAQQLAKREKQIVMLRRALKDVQAVAESSMKTHGYDKHHMQNISTCREALSATSDLSGCILCDAEPVGEVQHMNELNDKWISALPIGTPLYKAKEK